MNVDYLLKPSPATARKLAYLHSIMRLDIDDGALRLAGEGLLTVEEAAALLPEPLVKYVNERTLDLMQHSADHTGRFVFGTRTFPQSAAYSLMAAFTVAERVLVVHDNQQNNGDEWRRFLNTSKMQYCHVRTDKDAVDHDSQILLVTKNLMNHDVIKNARNRALVYVEQAGARTFSSSSNFDFSLDDLFSSISIPYGIGSIVDIAYEFPKVIQSFHTNPNDTFGKPIKWWESSVVRNMLSAIYPGLAVEHVLTTNSQHQNNLLKMGFILSSPSHIGKMLGVHVRFLVEDQKRPREDESPN